MKTLLYFPMVLFIKTGKNMVVTSFQKQKVPHALSFSLKSQVRLL